MFEEFESLMTYYKGLYKKVSEIEKKLNQLLIKQEKAKETNKFVVALPLDRKVRETTARDLLGLKKRQFEFLKEQGLIQPVNRHNYYLIRDLKMVQEKLSKL